MLPNSQGSDLSIDPTVSTLGTHFKPLFAVLDHCDIHTVISCRLFVRQLRLSEAITCMRFLFGAVLFQGEMFPLNINFMGGTF